MKPVDARSLEDGRVLETDVCIVGAGAAGMTAALGLARAGVDVLLVEGGDHAPDPATQGLHDVESVGYPLRRNYINRARQYGGSTNIWAGRNMLLWPEDLARRDWIAETRWPIPYEQLSPWLSEAAELLGLPDATLLQPATWRPRLGGAEPALFASGRLVPTVSLWATRPMRFGARHGPKLAALTNVRTLLCANAVELVRSADGTSIEALGLATLTGRRLRVRARRYILAAGGMENARLLLLAGLGGSHVGRFFMDHPRSVFGRVVLNEGVRLPLLRGLPIRQGKVQLGLALSPELQRRERLLNHYCTLESEVSAYAARSYETAIDVGKVLLRRGHAGGRLDFSAVGKSRLDGFIYQLSPKEILPHWAFRLSHHAKQWLRPPKGPQRCVVVTFCEQPPDPDSRLRLGDGRDALGLPRLVVDWRIGRAVHESLFRLHEIVAEELSRQGMGRFEPGEPGTLAFTDASHHLGTTRMSAVPEAGVVDTDCRTHDVRNLWLAGSSVFPGGGHANPTLTIVALALRLAAHLKVAA